MQMNHQLNRKKLLGLVLLLITMYTNAQISYIKMVGNNASNYKPGVGLHLKLSYPISESQDITFEPGLYIFSLNDNTYKEGTFITPLKFGYRYIFRDDGQGFYVEPQAGYNISGSTTRLVNGYAKDYKFNGAILSAGTGYIFRVPTPIDLNFHYETIMDGGTYSYISLGISVGMSLKKR